MSNNQGNRKTGSDVSTPELAAMTSEPELIMRNHANALFLAPFCQAELKCEAVQEPKECLELPPDSDIENPPSKPIKLARAPAVNPSNSNPLITTESIEAMLKMAIEESFCIFTKQIGSSMQKEADKALSDVDFGGFEEAITGFTNASNYFVKGVLTEMATTRFFGRHVRTQP